jgi:enoyl-CoA hydratase/carnithine racemase
MIQLSHDGPVARLVLNRPEARNALAVRHWEALADTLRQVAESDARLLVISGAGSAFSAGADLTEFPGLQADPAARTRFRLAMRGACQALADLPIATIAWIDGPCFGAGVALAMAADLRAASPAATFAITPAKMGIGYPQEDVARLVGLVGPGWAARLLFTGAPVDAATAERIGLVETVTDQPGREALIEAILACDPGSIAMLKRGIGLARRGTAADEGQDSSFDALFGSPVLAERLSRRRASRPLPPPEA